MYQRELPPRPRLGCVSARAASTQRLAVSQSAAGSLEDMGPNASRGDARAADERTDANRTQTQTGAVSRNAIVKSFARGLQVVKTLAEGHAPLTIAEVAERAQLTRAGARRLLLTLQELGYVALRGRHSR